MEPVNRVADITRDVVIIARELKGYCAAGIAPGDVIVLEGANIALEKTDKICGYAFGCLLPVAFAVRLGVNLGELGLNNRLWQCPDPGPPYTKGGTVLFEVLTMDQYQEELKKEA